MSSPTKTGSLSHSDVRAGNFYRIAIVGAGTLKGKEVAEVLNDRNFPARDVKLLDDDESLGQLENVGDEVTFIQKVRAEEFRNLDFTFFASDPHCTRKNWSMARDAGSDVVDLSFALEDEPGVTVRSPWIEREQGRAPAPNLQPGPVVVAHPAAVVLALLILRARKAGNVKSVIATVFEPASEHGQKGMDELHEQTVNLLSFQQLPKNVFDIQVAFNLITRYGEQSVPALAAVEARILRHYQGVSGNDVPPLSLLLVQAPIFHGHAFAIHLEFEQAVDVANVTQALGGDHTAVISGPEDAPNNVSAAGQPDVQVCVKADSNQRDGVWLWAASDNLRIGASTAVECAETMAANRPRGKVQ